MSESNETGHQAPGHNVPGHNESHELTESRRRFLGRMSLALSGLASHVALDQTQHVFYVAATGVIFELWWRGNDAPQAENLTTQAGPPFPYNTNGW